MGTPHLLPKAARRLTTAVWWVLTLLPAVAAGQSACNNSTQGTDFWVMFLSNHDTSLCTLKLVAASQTNNTIHVFNYGRQWDTVVNATAWSTIEIPISHENGLTAVGEPSNSALHVVSAQPISLYAYNFEAETFDIATVLPSGALGTEYITQTYGERASKDEVGVAAIEDNTVVTLHRSADQGGDTSVALMRGQAVQFVGQDLAGLRVNSNGTPFAMFQGNRCTFVGDCAACDHLYEQAMPVPRWGRVFVLVSTAFRASGDLVLVTSSEDGCTLAIDGSVVATLNQGESHRYDLPFNEVHILTASKPVYTCVYFPGKDCGNSIGDPSSVTIPPVEQFVHKALFQVISTPLSNVHYVNIVTRTADLPYITLDTVHIGDQFDTLPGGYSYLRKSLWEGAHILRNPKGGFLAHFYGLGPWESYAYVAAMGTHNLSRSIIVDSIDTRTHMSRISICPGRIVHFEVPSDTEAVSVEWMVDSQWVATNDGQLDYRFDIPGWHTVESIIDACDTFDVPVFVHTPSNTLFEADSCCFNVGYPWRGKTIVDAGIHYDTLTAVSGCDSLIQLTLTHIPKPPTGIGHVADCHENHYTLTALPADSLAFHWSSSPHDPLLDGHEQDTSVFAVPTGHTLYSLSFDYRCPYADTITLRPVEWPNADFAILPEWMTFDHPYIDAYDRSRDVIFRQWFINNILQDESGMHLHYDADAGIDSLLVSLAVQNSSCADTLHRIVPFVHTALWAPNVFTPDLGANDLFEIVLREGEAEELYIYNRQGEEISHLEGAHPQWDGTRNGSPCPQATYVWLLRYHFNHQPTRTLSATGTITLIR